MYSLKISNMWFWSIFKLSDSLIKPESVACSVKSIKSRSVSKNNKSWLQRILATEHLWKTWSVVSASIWQKEQKGIESYRTEKASYSNKAHSQFFKWKQRKWLLAVALRAVKQISFQGISILGNKLSKYFCEAGWWSIAEISNEYKIL